MVLASSGQIWRERLQAVIGCSYGLLSLHDLSPETNLLGKKSSCFSLGSRRAYHIS